MKQFFTNLLFGIYSIFGFILIVFILVGESFLINSCDGNSYIDDVDYEEKYEICSGELEELQGEYEELQEKNAELEYENTDLQNKVSCLEEQLEEYELDYDIEY